MVPFISYSLGSVVSTFSSPEHLCHSCGIADSTSASCRAYVCSATTDKDEKLLLLRAHACQLPHASTVKHIPHQRFLARSMMDAIVFHVTVFRSRRGCMGLTGRSARDRI